MKHFLLVAATFLLTATASFAGLDSPVHAAKYIGIIGVGGNAAKQGGVTITTTAAGRYTLSAKFSGQNVVHKGAITPEGTVDDEFPVKLFGGLVKVDVRLQFAISPDGEKITGTITANDQEMPFELYEAYPYTAADPAPQAGTFTALITPSSESGFPHGTGIAKLKVSIKGTVRVAGKLTDGASFNCGGHLSPSGVFQITNTLYKRKGGLVGTAQFSSADAATGELSWARPADATSGAAFPGTYAGTVTINIQRYTKPAALTPVIDFETTGNEALFGIEGGDLALGFATTVAINETNKVIVVGENASKLKLQVNKKTGWISGSIVQTIGSITKKRPVYLVVRAAEKAAEGFFLGATDSGDAAIRLLNE